MNKPSYSNPGGSGCRCSTPINSAANPYPAQSAITSATISGVSGSVATITVVYTGLCPFIVNATSGYLSDAGLRTIGVTYSGHTTTPIPALITALSLTSGSLTTGGTVTLTVTSAALDAALSSNIGYTNAAWPSSGAVNITSGGPFLIGITQNGLSGAWISDSGGGALLAIESLLDGNDDPNNKNMFYNATVNLNGSQYIQLDLGIQGDVGVNGPLPVQKYFTEFTFIFAFGANLGTWKLQVSNDPTFPATTATVTLTVDGGATFVLGTSGKLRDKHIVAHPAPVNGAWPQGYRYVRFTGMSGQVNSGAYLNQLLIQLDDWGATTPAPLPYPFSGNDLAISRAIDLAMSSGYRPSMELPGIVDVDSFGEIAGVTAPGRAVAYGEEGWGPVSGTISLETKQTRCGGFSMGMTDSGGGSFGAKRSLRVVSNYNGVTVYLRVAQNYNSDKRFTITLIDVAGKTATFPFSDNVPSSGSTDTRFVYRLSALLTLNAYSTVVPDSGFDITRVIAREILYGGAANDTVVLDCLVTANNPSKPTLALRLIGNQQYSNTASLNAESAAMFVDWITSNYPRCKLSILSCALQGAISATANLPNPNGAFASLGSSGYGNLPAFYLSACQKYGHQMESSSGCTLANSSSANTFPQAAVVYRDYPLSGYSAMGSMLLERYWLEGVGFASQSSRLYSNDSWLDWNAIDYALLNFDGFIGGTDSASPFAQNDGQLYCQYNAIGTISGVALTAEQNFVKNIVLNNWYYCCFAATFDYNATTGWGASGAVAHTASSNVLGFGAGWDFDEVDRPELYQCMLFFMDYLSPALNGTLIPGRPAAQWILPAQLLNANVAAGGGGGPGRLALGGL